LARVYDKGSYNSGVKGCQQMITEYSHSQEVASIFLKALTDKNSVMIAKAQSTNLNFMALSLHVNLFGFMAQKF
jgi:hypothetical protein